MGHNYKKKSNASSILWRLSKKKLGWYCEEKEEKGMETKGRKIRWYEKTNKQTNNKWNDITTKENVTVLDRKEREKNGRRVEKLKWQKEKREIWRERRRTNVKKPFASTEWWRWNEPEGLWGEEGKITKWTLSDLRLKNDKRWE